MNYLSLSPGQVVDGQTLPDRVNDFHHSLDQVTRFVQETQLMHSVRPNVSWHRRVERGAIGDHLTWIDARLFEMG
jgi:hypothetical protein